MGVGSEVQMPTYEAVSPGVWGTACSLELTMRYGTAAVGKIADLKSPHHKKNL